MNSRILAHIRSRFAVLLVLLNFVIMNATQAASEGFITSKDGLELAVRFEKTANPEGMQVKCKVTNRNQSDVQYMNTGPTMGLAFKLLDSSARELVPQAPWSSFITLQALDTPGKRSSHFIKPNESEEFNLPLNEAFGEDWRSAAKLSIEWIPGQDGSGNPLQVGKGLNTSFNLTGEQPRQLQPSASGESIEAPSEDHSSAPQRTTKASSPEQLPTPNVPKTSASEEPASSTSWSIIGVLIVAACGLLWLLLKRRSCAKQML